MTRVAVFGALHYDVVVDAPRLPRIDETLVGSAVDYRSGGKGGNQAIAAARMGASVQMIGRVGRDVAANTVLSALSGAGVDCGTVIASDIPTGMSVAITDPSGDYGAVIVSGANLTNDGVVDWKATPSVAVIQNEVPASANAAFVRHLPESCFLIWNAAPARPVDDEIARRTDLLVVNVIEATDLTGLSDPARSAVDLQSQVRGDVIVTLGEAGLVLARESGCIRTPAPRARVVSSHGAGDMFVGALAARLPFDESVENSVAFAQTAASLYVGSDIVDRVKVTSERVLQEMRP